MAALIQHIFVHSAYYLFSMFYHIHKQQLQQLEAEASVEVPENAMPTTAATWSNWLPFNFSLEIVNQIF